MTAVSSRGVGAVTAEVCRLRCVGAATVGLRGLGAVTKAVVLRGDIGAVG